MCCLQHSYKRPTTQRNVIVFLFGMLHGLVERGHVVAEAAEFDGGSVEVEFEEAADVGKIGGGGARLDAFVDEKGVNHLGGIAYEA